MKLPQLLLFDLGGVLIENNTFSRLQALLPQTIEGTELSILKEKWLSSPVVRCFELGQIAPSEFARQFIEEWSLTLSEQDFISEFLSWLKGYYPGAHWLIQRLRQKYRVACLSNSNVLHWEKFGQLDTDFDLAMSSHLLGAIKPDAAAFAMALAHCQVTPDEVWFFDDVQPNVLAAAELGIKAFHTDGFADVQTTLLANGIRLT
ncbi:HAD-IA family hydrolase [Undibacterium sp. TJN19]|uniref:HAD-IA family hydrolase n=1 Tax=Undibacterium sp. TJN19 TaxID=3413055 RepID=UPI003BF3FF1A